MVATDHMGQLARRRSFAVDTAEVRRARRFVTDVLTGQGLEALVPDAELAVSELFGNAIRHGTGATSVEVAVSPTEGGVRVEVVDDGRAPSRDVAIADPVPEDPTGRGLMVVGMLASDWGVDRTHAGTTVWFELAR